MLDFLVLWLLLLVPGLALVWRVWPEAFDHGPLAAVALGYVASFGLLTPLCVFGYIMRWPVAVLAVGYLASVVGAIAYCWRNLRLPTELPRPSAVAVIVTCVIVADLLLSTRNQSYLRGDASYHVARVNGLLNHGLSNADFLVPRGNFQVGYHSNLYHGLLAAFAWLTGRTAFEAWIFALGFSKLACAGGIALLASAVLGSRFWSWTAGGMFAVHYMPYGMLSYPNTLALDWLIPTGLALALEVQARRESWGPRILLGSVGLAAVQVHGLYYVFLVMMIGFAFVVDALVQWRRHQPLRPVAWALAMLLLGAPWIVAGRLAPNSADYAPAAVRPHPYPSAAAQLVRPVPDAAATDAGFIKVGTMRMLPPGEVSWRTAKGQLLLGLIVGLLWAARRAAFIRLGLMLSVVAAVTFIPPLCELAIRAGGEAWMIKRMSYVLGIGWMAISPGIFVLWLPKLASRQLVQVLVCVAGLAYANSIGVDTPKLHDRNNYLRNARRPDKVTRAIADHLEMREAFKAVKRRATVWAPLELDYEVAMACNCYPLASFRGSHGATDMNQRRVDVRRLVDETVPLAERLTILRHYGVRQFYAPNGTTRSRIEALYAGHIKGVSAVGSLAVVTVR